MTNPLLTDVELISAGPGIGFWSTPDQRQAAFDAEVNRRIDELHLRQTVDALVAAEAQRRQKRIRRATPVQVPEGKRYLSVKEVAALLQVHRRTVEKYIEEGVLKAGRIGGKGPYRVLEGEVQRLLGLAKKEVEDVDDFIQKQTGRTA